MNTINLEFATKTGENMAAELNGAEFFRKPFDFDAVVEKIRDTIGNWP